MSLSSTDGRHCAVMPAMWVEWHCVQASNWTSRMWWRWPRVDTMVPSSCGALAMRNRLLTSRDTCHIASPRWHFIHRGAFWPPPATIPHGVCGIWSKRPRYCIRKDTPSRCIASAISRMEVCWLPAAWMPLVVSGNCALDDALCSSRDIWALSLERTFRQMDFTLQPARRTIHARSGIWDVANLCTPYLHTQISFQMLNTSRTEAAFWSPAPMTRPQRSGRTRRGSR